MPASVLNYASPLSATAPGTVERGAAKIGYTLSAEEFPGSELLKHAAAAETAGFDFALISDHFHPWIDEQGNSPFVWSVLGALARATSQLPIGTGVTCPTTRIHPAIIAQAAATAAELLPGRFFLGVGSGERLNEHILGDPWPNNQTRVEQLAEAVELIRELWSGEITSFDGDWFTVDRARIYTLPEQLPPILIAAGGESSARLAAERGDGLIGVAPAKPILDAYLDAAEPPGPRIGQIQFCFAPSRDEALETAKKHWPNAAYGGNLSQEIALPSDFEAVADLVTEDALSESLTAGNDPEDFVKALDEYVDAGYDHVYFHQIGPDQLGAIDFVAREVLPAFRAQR